MDRRTNSHSQSYRPTVDGIRPSHAIKTTATILRSSTGLVYRVPFLATGDGHLQVNGLEEDASVCLKRILLNSCGSVHGSEDQATRAGSPSSIGSSRSSLTFSKPNSSSPKTIVDSTLREQERGTGIVFEHDALLNSFLLNNGGYLDDSDSEDEDEDHEKGGVGVEEYCLSFFASLTEPGEWSTKPKNDNQFKRVLRKVFSFESSSLVPRTC